MKTSRLSLWVRLFRSGNAIDRPQRYRQPNDELMRLNRQYNNVGTRIMEGRQQLSRRSINTEFASERFDEAA
ncbi:MAG: hypothetical protein RLZZ430_1538 [Cyanobacteriota bacterium]|jgi:hypothetical protein